VEDDRGRGGGSFLRLVALAAVLRLRALLCGLGGQAEEALGCQRAGRSSIGKEGLESRRRGGSSLRGSWQTGGGRGGRGRSAFLLRLPWEEEAGEVHFPPLTFTPL